jgi:RNA polymerase primary sigma factor
MDSYRIDPDSFDLLAPEEELQLARQIEERDVRAWAELLSWPRTTHAILDTVTAALGDDTPPCSELRRAAEIGGGRKRLLRAARDFAQLVRPLDLDREIRRRATARARRLARNSDTGSDGDERTPSRAAQLFLARVDAVDRESAELRERFIHANLRLVMSVARAYRSAGLPYPDLVQEGNLGLIKAVDRFDHRRGTRFSTFAVWWIRHTIGRAVADKSRLVRVPVHLADSRRRLASARGKLAAQLGRQPTADEVASQLEVPISRLERMDQHGVEVVMSLDAPLAADDSSRSWYDSFVETLSMQPDLVQHVVDTTVATRLGSMLDELRPIEADVIRKRFGLCGEPARTLREIAHEYGLSRERIRQIEQVALTSLRERLDPPDG